MTFTIQVSNPRFSGKFDPEDEALDECVETSFLLNTEMAIMEWNGLFIPLQYKYSISIMLPDILLMLRLLIENESGEHKITWPSNDFKACWYISWEGDGLIIHSEWNSVICKLENMLNETSVLKVSTQAFVFEWKSLLDSVKHGLSECGYGDSKVDGIGELNDVSAQLESGGLLYH